MEEECDPEDGDSFDICYDDHDDYNTHVDEKLLFNDQPWDDTVNQTEESITNIFHQAGALFRFVTITKTEISYQHPLPAIQFDYKTTTMPSEPPKKPPAGMNYHDPEQEVVEEGDQMQAQMHEFQMQLEMPLLLPQEFEDEDIDAPHEVDYDYYFPGFVENPFPELDEMYGNPGSQDQNGFLQPRRVTATYPPDYVVPGSNAQNQMPVDPMLQDSNAQQVQINHMLQDFNAQNQAPINDPMLQDLNAQHQIPIDHMLQDLNAPNQIPGHLMLQDPNAQHQFPINPMLQDSNAQYQTSINPGVLHQYNAVFVETPNEAACMQPDFSMQQPGFAMQPDFSMQSDFPMQPDFPMQQDFSVQPDFPVQQDFSVQPDFSMQPDLPMQPNPQAQMGIPGPSGLFLNMVLPPIDYSAPATTSPGLPNHLGGAMSTSNPVRPRGGNIKRVAQDGLMVPLTPEEIAAEAMSAGRKLSGSWNSIDEIDDDDLSPETLGAMRKMGWTFCSTCGTSLKSQNNETARDRHGPDSVCGLRGWKQLVRKEDVTKEMLERREDLDRARKGGYRKLEEYYADRDAKESRRQNKRRN